MRTLVACCVSWPVSALGFTDDEPVAVIEKNRVIAASSTARDTGIALGQRRRQAEQYCATLIVAPRDRSREARAFEPVVAAVAALTPSVEVTRPGVCAFSARGPTRYFGGEAALCAKVATVIGDVLGASHAPLLRLGIAEGRFAASLAARRGLVVPTKQTAAFLAPMPISVIDDLDLIDLLVRLGIRTLGAFAALPEDAVEARFGAPGTIAHHRARGLDDAPLRPRALREEFACHTEFDPPAERVDVAAFAARSMAEDLIGKLEGKGLCCVRLRIEAETEHGECLSRLWRADESFTTEMIIERLRWQLEGWLAGTAPEPAPSAGIIVLRVLADESGPATSRQLGLFGGRSDADARATRGLDRLRGLLGPDAVFTGALRGGRGPADRVTMIPWGEDRPPPAIDEPWPGHHPLPAPAIVYEELVPIEVRGLDGEPVRVLTRGVMPSAPHQISIDGGPWTEINAWAGPWLIDEHSWDMRTRKRRSRLQILTAELVGHLCVVEANKWWIEATYD